jgi:ATP-dependent exoDNAse (exonuclease V) beta subunit
LRLDESKITNAAMVVVERDEQKRLDAEEVRVFYVAATRAKKQLICLVDGNSSKGGLFARMVNRAEGMPEVEIDEINADPSRRIDFSKPLFAPSKEWDPTALAARASTWAQEEEAALATPLVTSPTALLGEFEKRPFIDEEFEEGRDRAIKIGHICHKVLEDWEFKPVKKGNSKLKPALLRAGRFYDAVPGTPEGDAVLKEAGAVLAGFFESEAYKKLCSVKIIGRELPFVDSLPENGVMRGAIDLLYEQEGKLVVADYKTNKLDGRSMKQLVEHFRPQGEAYQRAVKRALGRDAEFELIFLRS